MVKILFTLFTIHFSLVTLLSAASVRATVDTVEVVKGNPVTLRIKASGGSADFPRILMVDTAPVKATSTSSSRNLSMINGSVTSEASTTKIIQFIPEHDMTIPAYTVEISGKKYTTDPIDIKVVKSNASSKQGDALFTLEMKANKSKVHVGESFMVTVYFSLQSSIRLSQDVQYTPPNLANFLVTDVGEQQAYMNGNYKVQEIRYIVTPQKEGNFTISPANAKVGVPDRRRRDIFGMSFGTKWYQTASNSLKVEILPQTVASDLIGDFRVEATLDSQEVQANKPVNLTIKIEGKGNLSTFEYPKYEIDGVTVYSDEAKVDTKVVDGELYSIYSKSFAFISEEDFSIPERIFSMYDSKEEKLKELQVQAFDVKIKASKNVTSPVKSSTYGVVQTNEPQKVETKKVMVEKKVEVRSVAWWMLALAFGLGALFTYLLRFIPKRKENPYKESEALKILYGHMSNDPEVEAMVRKLYAKKNGDKSVQIDKKVLREMVERFI